MRFAIFAKKNHMFVEIFKKTYTNTLKAYLNSQKDSKSKKLQSITHEKSIDAFLSAISLSEANVVTEKNNIKVIGENQRNILLLPYEKEKELLKIHEQLRSDLIIPRRPYWDSNTTPEELERNEKQAFFDWRRKLASLQEDHDLLLTPFERNIEVWRQLWRVIEKCHLIVQIVDARNPLLFRSKDLERYVEEMDKKNFLLINKADLMTLKQRKYWADYFKMKGISYTFFSAILGKNIDKYPVDIKFNICENIKNENVFNGNKGFLNNNNILDKNTKIENDFFENEETRIVTVNELKQIFLKKIQTLKTNNNNVNIENLEKFYVGLVGYPNVGKSSTINSLIGEKKVSVSATPGKTKHFQTIHITDKLVLCDCPGLVFPNFSTTKADLVCNGILPIDQLQDYMSPLSLIVERIPKYVLESIYGIVIKTESFEENETKIFMPEQFLIEYTISRGIDKSKASRYIIKDYVNGKILFCNPPPGIDPVVFNSEYFNSFKSSIKRYPQTNDSIEENVSERTMLNNKEKIYRKTQELKNNKLLAFDKNFFCQNESSLELNQKSKEFYYKKYVGPIMTHSFEHNLQNNVLNKSKKHFNVNKRKNHRVKIVE
ncbi:uncharacterized protein T551_03267 [Pneumocystis jirovecii RU7]|uniref:CP-type G domain-containing protein n=1 Tax=Pneumocystis jirovecii (strain RU7) TaxID=1408657 RepID=A0A0W4ZEL6_PNEJ7|nr:uncharacterized protein T551_03267 [Pneumocystis jirovecii RU7]KTW26805.1 hypothetical protein T551_03267 [Pneumocystis jirovecii RU7]